MPEDLESGLTPEDPYQRRRELNRRLKRAFPDSDSAGMRIEMEDLRQKLEQADTENERVRQANLDVMMHFEDMKAAKEQAEARCAELEEQYDADAMKYSNLRDEYCKAHQALKELSAHVQPSSPFILRKQAEAIECWLNGEPEMGGLDDYANRLRQQAAEIERGTS